MKLSWVAVLYFFLCVIVVNRLQEPLSPHGHWECKITLALNPAKGLHYDRSSPHCIVLRIFLNRSGDVPRVVLYPAVSNHHPGRNPQFDQGHGAGPDSPLELTSIRSQMDRTDNKWTTVMIWFIQSHSSVHWQRIGWLMVGWVGGWIVGRVKNNKPGCFVNSWLLPCHQRERLLCGKTQDVYKTSKRVCWLVFFQAYSKRSIFVKRMWIMAGLSSPESDWTLMLGRWIPAWMLFWHAVAYNMYVWRCCCNSAYQCYTTWDIISVCLGGVYAWDKEEEDSEEEVRVREK